MGVYLHGVPEASAQLQFAGARRHKAAAVTLFARAVVTYVALYLFTTYLGIWFGQA